MDPFDLQHGINNTSQMEFNVLTEGDLKKYCRICLNEANDLESITNSSSAFKKLLFCNFLDITDEDGSFPKQICHSCKNATITSYMLKMQCIKSTGNLQEMFKRKQNNTEFFNVVKLEDNYSRTQNENEIEIKNLQQFDAVGNINNVDHIDSVIQFGKRDVVTNDTNTLGCKNNRSGIKHSIKKKLLKCNLCSREFLSKLHLSIHRKFVHLTKRTLKCKKCDRTFREKGLLINHIKSHKLVNTLKCELCQKNFKLENFIKHKCSHTTKYQYICKECGKLCKSALTLQRHMYIHNDESPYICDQCGKRMLSKTALSGHIRRKHSGENPFSCNVCGKAFSDIGDLIVHNRTHTGEKPFFCIYAMQDSQYLDI